MPFVEFVAELLAPEGSPGIGLVGIVLVEPVFAVIPGGIDHFKAVEGTCLLVVAEDHTEGVHRRGIISTNLLHGKRIGHWLIGQSIRHHYSHTLLA